MNQTILSHYEKKRFRDGNGNVFNIQMDIDVAIFIFDPNEEMPIKNNERIICLDGRLWRELSRSESTITAKTLR